MREDRLPRVIACCGGMVTVTGSERMVFEVLHALHERGAEVHCIVNGWENHRIVAMAEQIGATWSASAYLVKLDRHTRDPLALLRQAKDILQNSVDLLTQALRLRATHVLVPEHTTVIRSYPALLLLRLVGVTCVMRLSNAPDETTFYRSLWRYWIDAAVSHFVCDSRFTFGELVACGIAARKASLVRNVLPRRHAGSQAVTRDPRKIIFVGQVIPGKGLHVLLEAVALLGVRGTDVVLDVVGRVDGWISPAYGDYWVQLKARAAKSDLANRVRFLGWREDVDRLLQEASVHCCPSLPELRESFGVVVLEAKAAGIPSVVFRSGGLTEAITHGVDGWVSAEVTAEAMAEGIAYFIDDPARLARASENARRSAALYDRATFEAAWWALMAGAAEQTVSVEPTAESQSYG